MVRFVTFGETLAQYNATYAGPYKEDGDYMLDCAGAESNVAVDLQKLGLPGVETVWVSNVGDDREGEFILRELEGRTKVAARVLGGKRTGVSFLNHLPGDEHVKTYRRKGSAASFLTFADVEPHLRGADILHVTGITPALSKSCMEAVFDAVEYARSREIPVSFDLNYRPQLWDAGDARRVFEPIISQAAIFKLGHDEADAIWGLGVTPEAYAEHFWQMGRGVVVVTRGADGAIAYDGVHCAAHSGFKVEVVDPIGAGDAFVAGFLGGIIERCIPKELLELPPEARRPILARALEIANACGALTCTRRGDTAAMPTMDEVRQFIEARKPQA